MDKLVSDPAPSPLWPAAVLPMSPIWVETYSLWKPLDNMSVHVLETQALYWTSRCPHPIATSHWKTLREKWKRKCPPNLLFFSWTLLCGPAKTPKCTNTVVRWRVSGTRLTTIVSWWIDFSNADNSQVSRWQSLQDKVEGASQCFTRHTKYIGYNDIWISACKGTQRSFFHSPYSTHVPSLCRVRLWIREKSLFYTFGKYRSIYMADISVA